MDEFPQKVAAQSQKPAEATIAFRSKTPQNGITYPMLALTNP